MFGFRHNKKIHGKKITSPITKPDFEQVPIGTRRSRLFPGVHHRSGDGSGPDTSEGDPGSPAPDGEIVVPGLPASLGYPHGKARRDLVEVVDAAVGLNVRTKPVRKLNFHPYPVRCSSVPAGYGCKLFETSPRDVKGQEVPMKRALLAKQCNEKLFNATSREVENTWYKALRRP